MMKAGGSKKFDKKELAKQLLQVAVCMGLFFLAVAYFSDDDTAPKESATSKKTLYAPPAVAELSIEDYFARCHEASASDFKLHCQDKRVVWVMWFLMDMGKPVVWMAPDDGNDDGPVFKVSFAEPPDWGELGPMHWSWRIVSVSATVAVPDGKQGVLKNARVVPDEKWRSRAIRMVGKLNGVLGVVRAYPDENNFWISMRDSGGSRNSYAKRIVCDELWRAGRPVDTPITVGILDEKYLPEWERIGGAVCR